MKNLVELFCDVDDFCKAFIPQWQKQLLEDGTRRRRRECRFSMSENDIGQSLAIHRYSWILHYHRHNQKSHFET